MFLVIEKVHFVYIPSHTASPKAGLSADGDANIYQRIKFGRVEKMNRCTKSKYIVSLAVGLHRLRDQSTMTLSER